MTQHKITFNIWGFQHGVVEAFILLGSYVVSAGQADLLGVSDKWRWDWPIILKLQEPATNLCHVTSQNSEGTIKQPASTMILKTAQLMKKCKALMHGSLPFKYVWKISQSCLGWMLQCLWAFVVSVCYSWFILTHSLP